MAATTTDRIEKRILLRAPIARVWRAITDASEFGTWFGARFDAPFAPGARVGARIAATSVDPEIAKRQEQYAGMEFDIMIERMDAPRHFAFRWHPGAELSTDASDPTTLVTFDLEEVPEGTLLTIRESGFDAIPLERRAQAFEANEQGWSEQIGLIKKYLALAA